MDLRRCLRCTGSGGDERNGGPPEQERLRLQARRATGQLPVRNGASERLWEAQRQRSAGGLTRSERRLPGGPRQRLRCRRACQRRSGPPGPPLPPSADTEAVAQPLPESLENRRRRARRNGGLRAFSIVGAPLWRSEHQTRFHISGAATNGYYRWSPDVDSDGSSSFLLGSGATPQGVGSILGRFGGGWSGPGSGLRVFLLFFGAWRGSVRSPLRYAQGSPSLTCGDSGRS